MTLTIDQQIIEDQKRIETNLAAMAYKYPQYAVHTLHWLKPSMWIHQRFGKFWQGIRDITPNMGEYEAGKMATQAWLAAGLNMNGDFTRYIDVPDMDLDVLADRMKEYRYLLDAYGQTMKVVKAIQERDASQVRQEIEGYELYRNADSASMLGTDSISDEFIEALEAGNMAIPSGIPGIDRAIGGWAVKNTTYIAARPSMGKTALMLQAARNIAHQGKRAGLFECEMSRTALWARVACPVVGLSWKDVIGGFISKEQRDKLIFESRKLAEQYRDLLFIEDASYQTTDTIIEKTIKNRLDIVFVDHIGLLEDRPDLHETKRLGYISKELKKMAKSLEIPVVPLAQLNRGVESRDNKRPRMSDLRDSGEIEQNADTVLMIYRDEYYTEGADAGGITEIWVRKFRDGLRNSKIELEFDIKNEWFESPRRPY